MPETTTKRASLRKLKEPKFLTLTEKGANRTGFKIIRDDADTANSKKPAKAKFAMRADHPLLSILLPDHVGEADAYDMLEIFGLDSDYEVVSREDGGFMLKRKSAKADTPSINFDLGDGLTASVETSALAARSDAGGTGVVVTSIEFMGEYFSELSGVQDWLRGKDVAFKEGGVEVVDGGFIVTRHDVPEGVDTKKVAVQDGVTAIIAQAERADIPAGIVSPVSEYAYGNYGWGQLDFAASMADPEFTSASWDALYTIGRVLEDIIFNSYLNIDERKALIQRAIGQFGDFMNGLLDALPKEVLVQIRSDNRKTREEFITMATPKKEAAKAEDKAQDVTQETAQRTDAETENAEGSETASSEEETVTRTDSEGDSGSEVAASVDESSDSQSEFVTRSELEEVVNGAVAAAIAKQDNTVAAVLTSLQGTIDKLGEGIQAVQRSSEESASALQEKLDSIEAQTVVRSDDDDQHGESSSNKGGVFSGILGVRAG